MYHYIGLDIGTSSVKGVLMTPEGHIVKKVKEVFTYQNLPNGGLELDASHYLQVCFQTLRKLAEDVSGGSIKAICASSASGNLMLLDKEAIPMTHIINWQDQRVTTEAHEILGSINSDEFYRCIGWPFDNRTFPLAQLCYLKKNSPELLEQCGTVCMSTEYLYYTLTGKWGISTSAGTPFYLIDQEKGKYIEGMLDTLGIPQSKLPPILPCGHVLGRIRDEIAQICGIPTGTPVTLGSFDHPSAARGSGILQEEEMLLSCGTSWVAFFPVSSREKGIKAHMLIDPFLAPTGCYGAMTSLPSLSERIQYYVNRYIDTSEDAFKKLSALCAASPPGANGLSIDPLSEPDDAKITCFSKEDIARAIMEGTVLLLKEKLDALRKHGITAKSAVMVGGPSEDPMWISLIENICDVSVRTSHGSYAGAVGAAFIAQTGIGE